MKQMSVLGSNCKNKTKKKSDKLALHVAKRNKNGVKEKMNFSNRRNPLNCDMYRGLE